MEIPLSNSYIESYLLGLPVVEFLCVILDRRMKIVIRVLFAPTFYCRSLTFDASIFVRQRGREGGDMTGQTEIQLELAGRGKEGPIKGWL